MINRIMIAVLLVALAIPFVGCSNPHTPAFNEGYVLERPRVWGNGGFRGTQEGPSNFGVSLWNNNVIIIDMRPVTKTEQFEILAKDELNIKFRMEAILQPVKGTVKAIVEDFGSTEWYERFVQKPFRAFVRNAVRTYTSREMKDKRTEIANTVSADMEAHLEGSPFTVKSLVVGNIDYPKVVTDAVEAKLAAQQLLEEKATQEDIADANARIKVKEAKGIAAAQAIINKTLTDRYLQHEAIQAQMAMANSENHTTVYIPSGMNGIPMVKTIN